MESWDLLIQIVMLLGVCLLFGAVFSYFRQSPLVGYLLAGMLLGGPGSLHLVEAESDIEAISELGVALLLFSLGLEFSWNRLKQLGGKLLAAGALQVMLTAMLVAIAAVVFRWPLSGAVVLGAMLCLSSTAAVLRVLVDCGEIDSVPGRNSLAILLVQDIAVVPLALLVTLLVESGTAAEVAINVGRTFGYAAILIVSLYVLLNYVAVRFLGSMSLEQNRELTVLLAVVVGLGSTWSAHAVGLSPALGAFVAGMFLGSSPFATQVRADVSSLRVVLLTLFFGSVGMVADAVWFFEHLGLVIVFVAAVMTAKALLILGLLTLLRQPRRIALTTGLYVCQIGEFAFVLGSAAKSGGLLSGDDYALAVSGTILSLFVTPYLIQYGGRIADFWGAPAADPTEADLASSEHATLRVLLVGFGPAGQAVGRELLSLGKQVAVIDLNPAARLAAESMGFRAEIGDATQFDVLEHVHIRTIELAIIAIPSRSAALSILESVRALVPTAKVVVRSRYDLNKATFATAGADWVVGDEEEVGRGLSVIVRKTLQRWNSAENNTPPAVV